MPASEIDSIGESEIVLILTSAEKYVSTTMHVLRTMINQRKHECIYVTINRPYNVMANVLKEGKIDTKSIFFIDMISKMTNIAADGAEDCLFVSSPESLTELSIAINESVKNRGSKNKFLFFDSLSTLLLYNQAGTVTKFAHFLLGKMKTDCVEAIILSLEKEMDEKMINQLSVFVDKVIKVNSK
jgi:KaiC/GvpD/RAD55 family RecA-like ATPase